jgi:hypothetical protein
MFINSIYNTFAYSETVTKWSQLKLREVKRQVETVLNVTAEKIGKMEQERLILVQFSVFYVRIVAFGLVTNLI